MEFCFFVYLVVVLVSGLLVIGINCAYYPHKGKRSTRQANDEVQLSSWVIFWQKLQPMERNNEKETIVERGFVRRRMGVNG
jgi:hypothetical protein